MDKAEESAASFLRVVRFTAEQTPDFCEARGKDWVKFGEKNNYPDYLIKLYQRSSKHSAIVDAKVDYIIGDGIEDESLTLNPDEPIHVTLHKIAIDFELFNGFAFEAVATKGGKAPAFYHMPFNRLRTNKDRTEFYYTKNWEASRPDKEEDYKVLPKYNGKTGIFYYSGYSPKYTALPVYPLPKYIGCIPYIEIDYEIANFHLNNIRNSFWGSFLINFANGIPDLAKQESTEKSIKKKFAGTDNAGSFILNWSNGKDTAATLTPLTPNEMDKLFDILNKTVQEEIFSGHRVTSPMLFGIRTEGQLGGRSELVEAYELFKRSYIESRQKNIEEALSFLLKTEVHILEKRPISEVLPLTEVTISSLLPKEMLQEYLIRQYSLPDLPVLPALPPAPAPPATFSNEEKEKRVLDKFRTMGIEAAKCDILRVKSVYFENHEAAKASENEVFIMFAGTITPEQEKVLRILQDGKKMSSKEIAKALNISTDSVNEAVKQLTDAGYIKTNDTGALLITTEGSHIVPPPESITDIKVKYRYAKDPLVSGPDLLPTSRPFCKEMIGMSRLYTAEEIQRISNEEDYNVWLFRGGWYHRPGGDTTPFCRHIWQQVVVKERRGI